MSSFYSEERRVALRAGREISKSGNRKLQKDNSDKNSENTFMYHKMYCVGKKRGEKKH